MIRSGVLDAPVAKPRLFTDTLDQLARRLRQASSGSAVPRQVKPAAGGQTVIPHFHDPAEALRAYKAALSNISMHLSRADWAGLNRQLDNMFSEDSWDEEDQIPSHSAFQTFLSLYIWISPERRPGIGSNGRGSFTAAWTEGANRLTIECLPQGRIQWVLTRRWEDGSVERAAGDTNVQRVLDVIKPYDPAVWFPDAVEVPAG